MKHGTSKAVIEDQQQLTTFYSVNTLFTGAFFLYIDILIGLVLCTWPAVSLKTNMATHFNKQTIKPGVVSLQQQPVVARIYQARQEDVQC